MFNSLEPAMANVNGIFPMDTTNSIQSQHENVPDWLGRLGTFKTQSSSASRRRSSTSEGKHRNNTRKRVSRDAVSPERARHLERNRVAANKCRLKRKEEQHQIESTLDVESEKRERLMAEVGCLREQIWILKNEIFTHTECGDGEINQQLLQNMTSNALQESNYSLGPGSPSSSASVRSCDFATETLVPQTPVAQQSDETLFDSLVDVPM